MATRKFLLKHGRAPGDIVCMTALVRDIHLTYPGKYLTAVATSAMDLWQNNPYVTSFGPDKKDVTTLNCDYGAGIREQTTEPLHFVTYFHRDFTRKTGIQLTCQRPFGDLHLHPRERTQQPVLGRYWVMLAGGKSDFTIKVWNAEHYIEVARQLRAAGLGVVQVGSTDTGHWSIPIPDAINLVGKTNLRDLIQLIHHADGVICGVTSAMHIAAALQKPAVIVAGGREAWWWEAYHRDNPGLGDETVRGHLRVSHEFLHTIGLFDCCRQHGCWKNKVVPINNDKSLCKYPITRPGQPVALCMDAIKPRHVMDAVMKYYTSNAIPPIPQTDAERAAGTTSALPAVLNPVVPLQGRPTPQRQPATTPVADVKKLPAGDPAVLDNPDVGGRFTVCVLFYGDYPDMHRECLQCIVQTVPAGRMELRVVANQLGDKSKALIQEYILKGLIHKCYWYDRNVHKYPAMRMLFHDPDCPITTKWVIWFDDDSLANRDPNWLTSLAANIAAKHRRENIHMFGAKFFWTLSENQRRVFASRPWYKRRPHRGHDGKPSPNGNRTIFAVGGFWCISAEAIRICDIPDLGTGLTNNGGDWQIGEQLHQGGFGLASFNQGKQFIHTSAYPRRGDTTMLPGAAPLGQKLSPPLPTATLPVATQSAPPLPPSIESQVRPIATKSAAVAVLEL